MEKVLLKPESYILQQIDFALGDDNKYYAGQKVDADPSPDQCMSHWEKHGGAEWFRENFGIEEETESVH